MTNTKRPKAKHKRVWVPEYGPDGVLRRRFVSKEIALKALHILNKMLALRNRIWDEQRAFERTLDATYDRMTAALFGEFDPMADTTDLEGLRMYMYGITREDEKK